MSFKRFIKQLSTEIQNDKSRNYKKFYNNKLKFRGKRLKALFRVKFYDCSFLQLF